ncbi:MAG TPA: AAA family ATPase [Candidatus Limnocylindrales bacterium]|jgi:cellulose biosynthesis protein BcsQ|nr:AAA family ATPase [Candidatus Limnocylindrales bacterium]
MASLHRPAVAILLPDSEAEPVGLELHEGGFDAIYVRRARELTDLVATRRDIVTAVIDAEADIDGEDAWAALQESGRSIPALIVVDEASLDSLDLGAPGHQDDEFVIRPYSAESIRWRVEAMCIRSAAVDDGSGPILQTEIDQADWGRRGKTVVVFNPKGGVGKTMIATNLAAALVAKGQRVLLLDADTVTGHVPTSLGMDAVPTVVDTWRDEIDGGPVLTFDEMASVHTSGLKVLPLTSSPMATELLEPQRVAGAIAVARRNVDFVVIDAHPSYSPLNRAMLERADQILVPVTPDVPAIRALVQLRDVAADLGMVDRLSLVVNRAASGISVADIERSANLPAYAQIRSGGMLLVQANNEGRTLFEIGPRERITQDFEQLAARILGLEVEEPVKPQLRLFGRPVAVRA